MHKHNCTQMDETIPDLRFIELAQYVSPFWLIVSLQLDSLIGNIKVELFAKLAFSQISYIHFGTRVNESGFKIVVCFNAAQFSASQSFGEVYREFMQRFFFSVHLQAIKKCQMHQDRSILMEECHRFQVGKRLLFI